MAEYTLDYLLNNFKGDIDSLYESGEISIKLHDEYIAKNKEQFNQKVQEQLTNIKEKFLQQLKKSTHPDYLLKLEREKYFAWIYEESKNFKLPKKLEIKHHHAAIIASDIRAEIKRFIKGIDPDYNLSNEQLKRQIDAKVFIDYEKWLKNIFKYKYEDWLEGNIHEKFLNDDLLNSINWLDVLIDWYFLKKEEAIKIKNAQIKCFELAVELNTHFIIERFNKDYQRARDKEEFLIETENLIAKFKQENARDYSKANRNITTHFNITGKQYQKIICDRERFLNNKIYSYGSFLDNKSIQAFVNFNFHQYLIKIKQKADNPIQIKSSNFNFLGNPTKLNQLYFELVKHDLINEVQTSQEDFSNVFTKDFKKHNSCIHWNCETLQIRYIIDLIQPFFKDLRFNLIEESKTFYSKRTQIITANNLYSAGSKIRNFEVKKASKLKEIINVLK